MTEESNVLSSYIYTDGSEKKCNSQSATVTATAQATSTTQATSTATAPAPTNNLPYGINLTNSQGPNNFFLPNIIIS